MPHDPNEQRPRSRRGSRRPRRDPLVYEAGWDEDVRLAQWERLVDQTEGLPPTLATAIAIVGWNGFDSCMLTR